MARLCTAVLIFALVAVAVQAQTPQTFQHTFDGSVNAGSIYTSELYTLPGNPVNPIDVYIHYPSDNYDANVCFNSGGDISGVNLASTCPLGAFAVLSNNTGDAAAAKSADRAIHEVKLARKGTRFVGNERLAMDVEDESSEGQAVTTDVTGQLYIGPSGKLVVNVPGYNSTFSVTISGQYCPPGTYPLESAGNVTCSSLATNVLTLQSNVDTTISPVIGAVGSQYYVLQVPQANFLNITIPSVFDAYVMTGYIPTPEWSLPTPSDLSDNESTVTYTINTPGRAGAYETIFLRLDNRYHTTVGGDVTITLSDCPTASDIGPGCFVSSATNATNTSGSQVYELDAIVSSTGYNGTSVEFDLSEAEQDYAYFVLPKSNLPVLSNDTYFVRVSFANNVIDATGGQTVAPTVYAKMDGFPSAESYDYRVNGSLVNQVVVPVTTNDTAENAATGDGTWYFAVETPSDFSAWAGTNCANLCDNNDHGNCYCNTQLCNDTTSNGQDVEPLYMMPNNIQDSGGACRCTDDNYDQSFDCSEKTNKNSTLYIVLIAVGGAIVLAVAIGVPVYCYFQNRKRARYDRV